MTPAVGPRLTEAGAARKGPAAGSMALLVLLLTAFDACSPHVAVTPPAPATPRPADSLYVGMKHLNPRAAMELIDRSERSYVVTVGELRGDSLRSLYAETPLIEPDEVCGAALDALSDAEDALDAGSYRRAAVLFGDVVHAVPGCADGHSGYARALMGMASDEEASDGNGNVAWEAHALRLRAMDHLTIASTLDPRRVAGVGSLMPLHAFGRPDVPEYPEDDRAARLYTRGIEAHMEGDLEGARDSLRACIDAAPGFSRGYVALGDTYYMDGDPEAAARWYGVALRADSTDNLAWRSAGRALLQMGDLRAARDAAVWAVIFNYHDRAAWSLLTDVGRQSGFAVVRRRLPKRVDLLPDRYGDVRVVIDETLGETERIAWLGYAYIKSVWLFEGRFRSLYLQPGYSPSFREEFEAMNGLLDIWIRETEADTTLVVDPALAAVLRIAREGYLGEYALLEELAADNPTVARNLTAIALRRLREYVLRYVITGLST